MRDFCPPLFEEAENEVGGQGVSTLDIREHFMDHPSAEPPDHFNRDVDLNGQAPPLSSVGQQLRWGTGGGSPGLMQRALRGRLVLGLDRGFDKPNLQRPLLGILRFDGHH